MKIAIVQSLIGYVGGNDYVLRLFVESLKKRGHDVTIYSSTKPNSEFVNVEVIPSLKIKFPFFGIYQQLIPKKIKLDTDIIYVMTGEYANYNFNRKIICYEQNLLSTSFVPKKYNKGFWKLYYKPYNYFMNKRKIAIIMKQKFVASSDFVRKNLKEEFGVRSKVIYPPVDVDEFKPLTKKPQIVTIARFSKEKNIELLFKIASNLDYNFKLLTNVKNTEEVTYFSKLNPTKPSNLEIILNPSRDTIKKYVGESKVYLCTSVETFGISVIEAQCAGCITIVPSIGATKETVSKKLQYDIDNFYEGTLLVKKALCGSFDHLSNELQKNTIKYSVDRFTDEMLQVAENELST